MEERLDQRWKGIGANASFCAIMFKNLDISYPCFAPAHLTYLGCKQLQVKTRTLMRPNVSPAAAECWSIAKTCRDGCGGFAAGWRKNWNWKGGVKIFQFIATSSIFIAPCFSLLLLLICSIPYFQGAPPGQEWGGSHHLSPSCFTPPTTPTPPLEQN